MSFNFTDILPQTKLSYEYLPGSSPGIVYLNGFYSTMMGLKASTLQKFCQKQGHQFLRFDYRGHGLSDGCIEKLSIKEWLEDTLFLLDYITKGTQILVGSSMGAWIMILATLLRPQKIVANIGISAAPDFPVKLILPSLSLDQKISLEKNHCFDFFSPYSLKPYKISKYFLDQSKDFVILKSSNSNFNLASLSQPFTLFHGLNDQEVPWELSLEILNQISNHENKLIMFKDGNHRLSEQHHLDALINEVKKLIHKFS
ncbi:MAG: alpha/beta hydrolase [Alphaproteobacteria bacterium]|nr:alpha/beta hydrolase [Alphaproteobacteria bacterium]